MPLLVRARGGATTKYGRKRQRGLVAGEVSACIIPFEDVLAHSPRSEAKKPKAAKTVPPASGRTTKKSSPKIVRAPAAKGASKSAPAASKPATAKVATATKAPTASKPAKPVATQLKKPTASTPVAKAAAPSKTLSVAKQPPRAAVVTKARELLAPQPKAERGAPAKAKSTAAAATPASPSERAAAIKAALLNKQAPVAKSPPTAKAPKAAEAPREEAPSAPPPPKKPARKSIKEAAGVSTDAVARRTGKNWDDWFEVLDNAGAATLDQRGIIAILAQKHGIGPWWQQMIAVGYESLRSKSDKPPAADGFQINSSCTLDAPLARVFRLWNDAGERARWLSDDRFVVRGTTGEKTIRARWGKGNSHVAVSFAEKSGRTQVSVDHLQIESRDAAEQMKAYWAKKLGLLEQALAPRR